MAVVCSLSQSESVEPPQLVLRGTPVVCDVGQVCLPSLRHTNHPSFRQFSALKGACIARALTGLDILGYFCTGARHSPSALKPSVELFQRGNSSQVGVQGLQLDSPSGGRRRWSKISTAPGGAASRSPSVIYRRKVWNWLPCGGGWCVAGWLLDLLFVSDLLGWRFSSEMVERLCGRSLVKQWSS